MKQEAEFEASSGPSEHLGGPAPEKPQGGFPVEICQKIAGDLVGNPENLSKFQRRFPGEKNIPEFLAHKLATAPEEILPAAQVAQIRQLMSQMSLSDLQPTPKVDYSE